MNKIDEIKNYIENYSRTKVQLRLDKWYSINPFLIQANREAFLAWCERMQDAELSDLKQTADNYINKAGDDFITVQDIKNLVNACGLDETKIVAALNQNFNVILKNIPQDKINTSLKTIKDHGYDCRFENNELIINTSILAFQDYISY